MEKISKADAQAVLAALRAQYPAEVADAFTLVADFDDREWVILGEEAPEGWPFNFPYGDDETQLPDVFALVPAGVYAEAINHYSVALYRR